MVQSVELAVQVQRTLSVSHHQLSNDAGNSTRAFIE
jgi:hypothetical protein